MSRASRAGMTGWSGIRLLDHAVLRAPAWPIETVDAFAAPGLAAAAAAVASAEAAVRQDRADALAALHAAIPASAPTTRRYLLAAKRHVHRLLTPLPEPPSSVSASLDASPELVRLLARENAARHQLAACRNTFEREYADELLRQRTTLRSLTHTARFRKALVIANPSVAAALRRSGREVPSRRRGPERRLEMTLFRYLMRAATQPTPSGAWAGVASISPVSLEPARERSGLHVTRVPVGYSVTVDLRPFVRMLGALRQAPRYRDDYPLRLNPTLHSAPPGWEYERTADGKPVWVQLPEHALFATVIGFYQDGQARPVGPLLDLLARSSVDERALRPSLSRLVDRLIDQDVLQSDLSLPSTARSVWEALAHVIERLLPPDRSLWSATVGRIRVLADRLAAEYDALEPDAVEGLRSSIAAEVQQLWTAAGLSGRPPEPALRLDMRLPFRVGWDETLVSILTDAVRVLLDFHAADGGAELFRRETVSGLARSAAGAESAVLPLIAALFGPTGRAAAQPFTDERAIEDLTGVHTREALFSLVAPQGHVHEEAMVQCRRWEAELEFVHDRPTYALLPRPPQPDAQAGPSGAVLLRLQSDRRVWLGPGRPEAGIFAGRFGPLLANPEGSDGGVLTALRAHLARAGKAGLTAVEIVGWHPANPNAALRPLVTTSVMDPHGQPGTNLQGVQLRFDSKLRPWLRSNRSHPLVPVYNSAAELRTVDHCAQVLLSLAHGHGWEFLAFGFPQLRVEQIRWRHLPRLLLSEDVVLSAERWTVDQTTLRELALSSGPARYAAWRGIAERLHLPARIFARWHPDAPELLLRADSPFAVECLFDTIDPGAPWLVLTEGPTDLSCWPLVDAQGQHYVSELAVTWCDDHYWSKAADEAGLAAREP